MIFQIAEGSVFHDHVGLPLHPSLSLIYHAYIITIPLCIQLKNEELNFDWVAISILQSNHFKRPSSIKRPVIMSNQCPEITELVNNGKLYFYWAPTAIKQSLPPFCLSHCSHLY